MDEKQYYIEQMDKIQVSEHMQEQVLQYSVQRKRYDWKVIGAMAAVMAIGALFVIPSPLSQKVKAYCELAFLSINDMSTDNIDVSDYTTNLRMTEADGDVSLQLNEALLDGNHFVLSYTIACTEPRFFIIDDADVGYYAIGVKRITINGVSKKYTQEETLVNGDQYLSESEDFCTYEGGIDLCLCDMEDVFANSDDMLNIELELVATDPDDDKRQFSYQFTVENRKLQLDTKEIPINKVLKQDDVTFTLEKMCINAHSQRIYFHVEGLDDFDYLESTRSPYDFGITGVDENGNEVFSSIEEIHDGYGYFLLHTMGEDVKLSQDVSYYDLQMDYSWTDPAYVVCDDEHEGEWHGREGLVGEIFRVNCGE